MNIIKDFLDNYSGTSIYTNYIVAAQIQSLVGFNSIEQEMESKASDLYILGTYNKIDILVDQKMYFSDCSILDENKNVLLTISLTDFFN